MLIYLIIINKLKIYNDQFNNFFLNIYFIYKKWICQVLYNYKNILNCKIKINLNNYKIVNIIILLMIIKIYVNYVVW